MADKKISALNASTTPLAGTEVLPIVQSGATVKVAVSDLTAGRAISATQATLTTGDLVIGTAGKGIDFSANANAPGMTSELLTWYEEGNWTPTDASGAGLTFTVDKARYTRVGNLVSVFIRINYPVTASAAVARIAGLPFNAGNDVYATSVVYTNVALGLISHTIPSDNDISFTTLGGSGATVSNAQLSGSYLIFSFQYSVV